MNKTATPQRARHLLIAAVCTTALALGMTAATLYAAPVNDTQGAGVQTAYASIDNFVVKNKSIKLTKKNADVSYIFMESTAKKGAILSAKSSKKSVAAAKVQNKGTSRGIVTVYVKAAGKTTISVATEKATYKIKLTVKKTGSRKISRSPPTPTWRTEAKP